MQGQVSVINSKGRNNSSLIPHEPRYYEVITKKLVKILKKL